MTEYFDKKEKYDLYDLFDIMRILMSPDGCPWDSIQTHDSIKNYIVEEAYEVMDAVEKNDSENLCEELGDVLLHVVFHSILSEKEGNFCFDDVVDGIAKKMVYRHPNIFGSDADKNADWDSIKKAEKGYKNNTDALKSVPRSMPALMRGQKILSKANKFGYNNGTDDPYEAAINDITALRCLKNGSIDHKMEIVGNILINLIEISSNNEISSELALTKTLEKVINRFETFENSE